VQGLFSASAQLREALASVQFQIRQQVRGDLELVESITLPDFGGHIILRFNLPFPLSSLEEIDTLEMAIRRQVAPEYWAALTADAYRHLTPGLTLAELPSCLGQIASRPVQIPVPHASSRFSQEVRKDAEIVRARLGQDCKVWEIEMPLLENDLPVIRLLVSAPCAEQMETLRIEEQDFRLEFHRIDGTYQALISAYLLSAQAGQALLHFVFDQQERIP
jgi:hypothetical protein